MSAVDRERVVAALGARLADRFLQYAHGEPGGLMVRIDAHLAEVRRAAERWSEAERSFELVERTAAQCKRLLARWPTLDDGGRAAVVGAVRYFLDTHDLERDDEPAGFVDDARVVAYVVGEVAPDLAG